MPNYQFQSKDDVLEAFENSGATAWAIWSGRELNFSDVAESSSEAKAALAAILELIDRQGTGGYFKLCMYDADDIGDRSRITNKTAYVSSFVFRLDGYAPRGLPYDEPATVGGYSRAANQKVLLDELVALRKEVEELKNGDDEDGDDDYGLGKIGRILQHPTIGPAVQALVANLGGALARFATAPGRVVAGVPDAAPGGDAPASADPWQDPPTFHALRTLYQVVPDFSSVLVKLGQLAEKQPNTLSMYVSALKGMNI